MIGSGCFTTNDIADYSLFYGFYNPVIMFYMHPMGEMIDMYKYDPFLSGPGNGIKIIKPINLDITEPGRWVLQIEGKIKIDQYEGITDVNGNFSISYPIVLSAIPNVYPSMIGELPNQKVTVVTSTVSGFTVNIKQRNTASLLGIEVLIASYANVPNMAIKVLIIETL